ncbi:hypothetical protein SteCoe_3935 [Stentor coeruleus]|uniref:Uncharacterized protein n=1 Tax=Stentor coeruleus TaxID=5963 RepID=A0A1R2CVT7_9CILI|nr:hypothetical protein SteCoe_3935 [Stentor coeruleus]
MQNPEQQRNQSMYLLIIIFMIILLPSLLSSGSSSSIQTTDNRRKMLIQDMVDFAISLQSENEILYNHILIFEASLNNTLPEDYAFYKSNMTNYYEKFLENKEKLQNLDRFLKNY